MSPERKKKLDEEETRGHEARLVIESPLYRESMAKLRQGIIDKWAACPARDVEGREWLWQHYQVALKFEETLTEVLNTGKLAIEEKRRSMPERVANLFRR